MSIKEGISYKKQQNEIIYQQFTKDLNTETIANKSAQSIISSLKKKLEEKRLQIQTIRNPNAVKNDSPKNFLASEKLAFTKKRRSLSPRKAKSESKTQSPIKRVNSTARKRLK